MYKMKSNVFFMAMIALALGMYSCKNSSSVSPVVSAVSPQTTLDWAGTYSGVVPCADCPGIEMELTLNTDSTYTLQMTYQERASVYSNSGSFTWDNTGTKITLKDMGEFGSDLYLVQENKLILLDADGNLIESDHNYTLSKTEAASSAHSGLTDRRWKLVELAGKPVTYPENHASEAFISFKQDGTVNGNFSCNTFNGTYTLQEGNRIRFSKMAATQKMCLDMTVETDFAKVLETTDSYNMDGDNLILNRARMAPLARFEAVYMK
jgi:heat shock protein HslJ